MRTLAGRTLAAVAVFLGACGGGAGGAPQRVPNQGVSRGPAAGQGPGVQPGISPQMVIGDVTNPYAGNRTAIAAGRQLFTGMNCAGCHSAYAGGGMGPSLRDSLWIYGSKDVQIFSTLAEGRPNGMPAWGGRLNDEQLWQLVAYIKTLSTPEEPVKPPRASQGDMRVAPAPSPPHARAGG